MEWIKNIFSSKKAEKEEVLDCGCNNVEKHYVEIMTSKDKKNYKVNYCKKHISEELSNGNFGNYLGSLPQTKQQ